VYIGSLDGNLYALDASTGEERWRQSLDGEIYSSPAVVDGVVYAGSFDDGLYALSD
jgi:outer membrane protein assembly factor BamB